MVEVITVLEILRIFLGRDGSLVGGERALIGTMAATSMAVGVGMLGEDSDGDADSSAMDEIVGFGSDIVV